MADKITGPRVRVVDGKLVADALGLMTGDVTAPTAYTQTYSTADRTHANLTSSAVVTTAATSDTPFGFSEAQANAIVAAINALRTDLLDTKQLVNSVIDDLQALGLLG